MNNPTFLYVFLAGKNAAIFWSLTWGDDSSETRCTIKKNPNPKKSEKSDPDLNPYPNPNTSLKPGTDTKRMGFWTVFWTWISIKSPPPPRSGYCTELLYFWHGKKTRQFSKGLTWSDGGGETDTAGAAPGGGDGARGRVQNIPTTFRLSIKARNRRRNPDSGRNFLAGKWQVALHFNPQQIFLQNISFPTFMGIISTGSWVKSASKWYADTVPH